MDSVFGRASALRRFPAHGWFGLTLIALFWPLNWGLDGLRTHWGFFPLWLGYSLTVDGINVVRRGTSIFYRNRRLFLGLFLISAPIWWSFELINWRTQNWIYLGREFFSDLEYLLLASLSFSTVIPAVLGTAELFAGLDFVRRLGPGPVLHPDPRTTRLTLLAGLAMFLVLMAWPSVFFPFTWTFMVLMLAPINAWLGHRSIFDWTRTGNWRPVVALGLGVLTCGFFWEMWNFFSYPKWIYSVPYFDFLPIFEMPILGYLGYIPFALELVAVVYLVLGLLGSGAAEAITAGLDPELKAS